MIDTYKPPLFEGVLLEGSFGPVVVGEIFNSDVIPPHGRVDDLWTRGQ